MKLIKVGGTTHCVDNDHAQHSYTYSQCHQAYVSRKEDVIDGIMKDVDCRRCLDLLGFTGERTRR